MQTLAPPVGHEPANAPETKPKTPQTRSEKVRFGTTQGFQQELKRRVDEYFETRGISRHGNWSLWIKTAFCFLWLAASYALLVFGPTTWWSACLLATSCGLAVAAIGFNVQHDGGHKAYSEKPWVNRVMAGSLDMLGASSYLWNVKHNVLHHTYANIQGHDDDIELGIFGRLCPHQKRLWFHRWQHIYLWFLYGFLSLKWNFFDDYANLILAKYGETKFARPKGWDLVLFIGGKVFFSGMVIVLPMFFNEWYNVLGLVFLAAFVEGVVLSVVFQMAHVLEESSFPLPDDLNRIENEWMVHQIETTVDFARGNKLVNWYVGGLNFQVEHHLFPRVAHVHYPELSKIVEEVCAEYGVNYQAHPSVWSSLKSHYRLLRTLGRGEETTMAQAA